MEIQNSDWDNHIIAYLNNTISEEDKVILENWISASPDNLLYFNQFQNMWDVLQIVKDEERFDSEKAFIIFQDRVKKYSSENNKVIKSETTKIQFFNWKNCMKYAAFFLVFIGIGISYKFISQKTEQPLYSGVSQIVVPNGSKTDIVLLDGTHVLLNSGSKIELASNFGNKERVVKLQGEAYFTVAHDSLCPFFVEAGGTRVKVLGTTFNVDAYPTNEEIRVFLAEGSVEMNTPHSESINLKPNQLGIYNINTQTLSLEDTPMPYSPGWLNDELIFFNETFEQIAHKLERKFDIKINIHNNTIKKRRFTGDFVNNETIDQIFKVIFSDNRFHYKINKSEIDIY